MKWKTLLLVLALPCTGLFAQTKTWAGGVGFWDDAAKWSPSGVPAATDIVTINTAGGHVTIPFFYAATAKGITISGTTTLTITVNSGLEINGLTACSPCYSLNIGGGSQVVNNGSLNIGATHSGNAGIFLNSNATFTNNSGGGSVVINNAQFGIQNFGGSVTNHGSINLGGLSSLGTGISVYNGGTMTNHSLITIDNVVDGGISVDDIFDNFGTINIGSNGPCSYGLLVGSGTFTNKSSGLITINNSPNTGNALYGFGTMMNEGTLEIGLLSAVNAGIYSLNFINKANLYIGNITGDAILQSTTVQNNSPGSITVVSGGKLAISSTSGVLTNSAGANLTNHGTITGGTLTNAGTYKGQNGIYSNNTFTNGGIVAPGLSPGCLSFNNGYNNGSGILRMEINGPVACVDFDQLNVTGTFTASGTLEVDFGSSPANGQTFQIVNASTYAGSFPDPVETPSTIITSYANGILTVVSNGLPVELVYFRAKADGQSVRLDWQTASETNNQGFYVEGSPDGRFWKALSFVQGNGSSTARHDYSFSDNKPLTGTSYYRLRQIDFDGTTEYSPVQSVTISRNGTTVGEFYPNPVSNTTVAIDFAAKEDGEWQLQITDLNGKSIFIETRPVVEGNNVLTLDVAGLAAGVYFVKMENGPERVCRKLVKG